MNSFLFLVGRCWEAPRRRPDKGVRSTSILKELQWSLRHTTPSRCHSVEGTSFSMNVMSEDRSEVWRNSPTDSGVDGTASFLSHLLLLLQRPSRFRLNFVLTLQTQVLGPSTLLMIFLQASPSTWNALIVHFLFRNLNLFFKSHDLC